MWRLDNAELIDNDEYGIPSQSRGGVLDVKKIIIGAVVAIGSSVGAAQPALAVPSATPQQCAQAQAAVGRLQHLADSATDPAMKRAYTNMVKGQQIALSYYC